MVLTAEQIAGTRTKIKGDQTVILCHWKCNVEAAEETDDMACSILKLDLSGNWH